MKNFFITLSFGYLMISCISKSKIKITFDKNILTSKCGSGFNVKSQLEKDYIYLKEFEKYLYKVFIDYKVCENIEETLFERESFIMLVLDIYDNKKFIKYSIYDDDFRWKQSYVNLVNYCTNDEVVYKLCDSLLLRNIEDGLIAMWDKDANNLTQLKKYEEKNFNDYYQLANLIAIYHNSGMYKQKIAAINQILKIDSNRSKPLLNFININNKIDYSTFMELVYGGM